MIKELAEMVNKISPQINALRTFILIVFHQHICVSNANEIYAILNAAIEHKVWFYAYIWSMQFVSNKFA
jgi:hypothetical protein